MDIVLGVAVEPFIPRKSFFRARSEFGIWRGIPHRGLCISAQAVRI